MDNVRKWLRDNDRTLGWLAEQLGLSRDTVKKWPQIPAKHVLAVEAITGIPRWELRPDYYPKPQERDVA